MEAIKSTLMGMVILSVFLAVAILILGILKHLIGDAFIFAPIVPLVILLCFMVGEVIRD